MSRKIQPEFSPDRIRTIHPAAWPQWPYDEPPPVRERSEPRLAITSDMDLLIPMRDGVLLAADVYRLRSSGQKFPVLLSLSPYTRGLQLTDVPLNQNEAGITQFWVPRGYVHLIVDVRGTNDSGGICDDKGEKEQADYVDLIEWAGAQPWSNGSVGMMGCSYFAESKVLAATHQPEALKAIFPYDAFTDLYRNRNCHGGIPYSGFMWNCFSSVAKLNLGGERVADPSGINKMIREGICFERPLDSDYYKMRSPFYDLDNIKIPTYFVCDWDFWWLHLPGVFDGWEGVGDIPKDACRPSAPALASVQRLPRRGAALVRPVAQGHGYRSDGGPAHSALHPGRGLLGGRGNLAHRAGTVAAAEDTDWLVSFADEGPEGDHHILTNGWLRASHRALDDGRSKPGKPWHPHTDPEPLTPGPRRFLRSASFPPATYFSRDIGCGLRLQAAPRRRREEIFTTPYLSGWRIPSSRAGMLPASM
jgi:predicted acyl esterase